MRAFEEYVSQLRVIRSTGAGVPEESYYGALERYLNAIGARMAPPVTCVMQLRNAGAGEPDGGLFTPDQFNRDPGSPSKRRLREATLPVRGAIEIKGMSDDSWRTAVGSQVSGYLGRYGQVLVTNYRDFLLLVADTEGTPTVGETYRLAEDEAAFWKAADDPARMADAHAERLEEYLTRVLLHAAPLASPQALAVLLAAYAREARARVLGAQMRALAEVRVALEGTLGVRFDDARGIRFFESSLVQTLFYGVFSAWVLWCGESGRTDGDRFDWRTAGYSLRVPMIRALFGQIAQPDTMLELDLVEVLDWAGAALARVQRAAFFSAFAERYAVQYFYEPFLEAFDPELRRELGVWYTPPEVVDYMVSRVDTVLREELGIADGLADESVFVLDPCSGTATYVVAVLDRIAATLRERGMGDLLGAMVKRAATTRIVGFELLPAPFVVAHLQVGLLLARLGVSFGARGDERAAVYLTNALTGWTATVQPELPFRAYQQERDAADGVKLKAKILVILGNPPYRGFAGVALGDEGTLVADYRTASGTLQPDGQGLNDLYVRFFAMAERRIATGTSTGIVCYISNYSWLEKGSYSAMRERYLNAFDRIWIDVLNGDSRRTGKRTPEGLPDPSIFSTPRNPSGIRVGTAITLMARRGGVPPGQEARRALLSYRSIWGAGKLARLAREAIDGVPAEAYGMLRPEPTLGLQFVPLTSAADYAEWPALPALLPDFYPGVKTSRDELLVDVDRDRLEGRMRDYLDPDVSNETLRRRWPGAAPVGDPAARARAGHQIISFNTARIVRYAYRPFDVRWLYWDERVGLLDRPRQEFEKRVGNGVLWIEARERQPGDRFDRGSVVAELADNFGNGLSSFFPSHRRPLRQFAMAVAFADARSSGVEDDEDPGGGAGPGIDPGENNSPAAAAYLARLGATHAALFAHIVATLHAPAYRAKFAPLLKQGWPRVPLPATLEPLLISAALGERIIALNLTDTPVPGVTAGKPRPELRLVSVVTGVGGTSLDDAGEDLAVTASWGSRARPGAPVMPGTGHIAEREYSAAEREAIEEGAAALGRTAADLLACLGEKTVDVYLSDSAFWSNVPQAVWGFFASGHPVLKKWLSYRDRRVLGRPLRSADALAFRDVARRIAALLLYGPALDAAHLEAAASAIALREPIEPPDTEG